MSASNRGLYKPTIQIEQQTHKNYRVDTLQNEKSVPTLSLRAFLRRSIYFSISLISYTNKIKIISIKAMDTQKI